jgi:hypothetical protein
MVTLCVLIVLLAAGARDGGALVIAMSARVACRR